MTSMDPPLYTESCNYLFSCMFVEEKDNVAAESLPINIQPQRVINVCYCLCVKETVLKFRQIFNITSLTDHPGGEEVLLEPAAKDATVAFNDVGHSEDTDEETSAHDWRARQVGGQAS